MRIKFNYFYINFFYLYFHSGVDQGKDIRSYFSPLKERNSVPINDKVNICDGKKNSASVSGIKSNKLKNASPGGDLKSVGLKKNSRSIFAASNTKTVTTTVPNNKRFCKDTGTESEIKVNTTSKSNSSITPFQGVGYKLGGDGISRNLNNIDNSRKNALSITDEKNKSDVLSLKSSSNFQSYSGPSKSSEFAVNRENMNESFNKSSSRKNSNTGNSSHKSKDISKRAVLNGDTGDTDISGESLFGSNSDSFPCPICQENFRSDVINQHVESHFD